MYWRNTVRNILYLFFIVSIASCSSESKIEPYDLNREINVYLSKSISSEAKEDRRFSFCKLLPKDNWQSAYVISPYTPIEDMEALNLDNFNKVRDRLKDIAYTDHKIGLLFVRNDSIYSYSIIDRSLDFAGIGKFSRSDCKNLYIKTTRDKTGTYTHQLTLKP